MTLCLLVSLCPTSFQFVDRLSQQVSLEHVEKIAEEAMKIHDDAFRGRKDNYVALFLDSCWEQQESEKALQRRRAVKREAQLAAEAEAGL